MQENPRIHDSRIRFQHLRHRFGRERKSLLTMCVLYFLLMMIWIYAETFRKETPPEEIQKDVKKRERSATLFPSIESAEFSSISGQLELHNSADHHISADLKNSNVELHMAIIIEKQKRQIEAQMSNYKFHPASNVTSYHQLLLPEGRKPIRNMIATTWRSGSTFLGELTHKHPASFYHYEPLLPYGITTIRDHPLSDAALKDIRKLLNCDYYNMEHYIKYLENQPYLFSHNEPLWKICQRFTELCSNPKFLSAFCSLFPFQNIKTVRLHLNLTEEFLEHSSAKVLLLVRDPRGTIQSRHDRKWCPENPDCSDPRRLCQDLVDDYHSAKKLSQKYRHSFKAIRYEDLSFNVQKMSREVFDFFHLSFGVNVRFFLNTHTKVDIGGASSTVRDSKAAPFHWQKTVNWTEVQYIQDSCKEAMQLWGYKLALSEYELRKFKPVVPFKFPK